MDIERVTQYLKDYEAEKDLHGWDAPPEIFLVITNGEDFREIQMPRVNPDPVVDLQTLAMLVVPDLDKEIEGYKICGIVLLSEAWMIKDEAAKEYAEGNHSERLVDHPDRLEVRTLNYMSANFVHIAISRIRGEEPDVKIHDDLAENKDNQLTGRIPEAMRQMFRNA